jgi:2-iminobutanoate/2-iminopropanoate deaminase
MLLSALLLLAACAQPGGRRQFPGPQAMPVGATAVRSDSVAAIPGFSSAIKRGLTLYISGQVPLDSAAHLVAPGDLAGQTKQASENVLRVVRAGRGLPGDVVKLTYYVVDLDSAAASTVHEAAAALFTETPPPAITIVGVAALPGNGIRVAVDGIAMLRGEFPDRERMGRQVESPE